MSFSWHVSMKHLVLPKNKKQHTKNKTSGLKDSNGNDDFADQQRKTDQHLHTPQNDTLHGAANQSSQSSSSQQVLLTSPMDPAEEQSDELEALEAIFDSDFRIAEPATKSSGARFEIELSDFSEGVKLRLIFTHTSHYPETPIRLVVYALSGVSTQRRQLLQTFLEGVAEKNLSVPCVYPICQAAQEWVEEHVIGAIEEVDTEQDSKFETFDATQEDKVEVISSKTVGTPVTVETFNEWREKFFEELQGLKTKEQLEKESNEKMTGRQFFENKNVVVSAESESFWEQEASQIADTEL